MQTCASILAPPLVSGAPWTRKQESHGMPRAPLLQFFSCRSRDTSYLCSHSIQSLILDAPFA